MHTEDMGGLGRWEDLLLIKLNLQCIAYGVYDNVEFWKTNCHDSVCFKFNESVLMDRLNGYKKRNEKGQESVPRPPPPPPPTPIASNIEISEFADLQI